MDVCARACVMVGRCVLVLDCHALRLFFLFFFVSLLVFFFFLKTRQAGGETSQEFRDSMLVLGHLNVLETWREERQEEDGECRARLCPSLHPRQAEWPSMTFLAETLQIEAGDFTWAGNQFPTPSQLTTDPLIVTA